MRNITTWSLLTSVAVFLIGCANMQTISRTTKVPSDEGIAIHLDAQQRVVLSDGKVFCAEPSPDALSAYAASLVLGINEQMSATQNSSATDIGLRTQSITLMRDAFYRICEAYSNDQLEKWEVSARLRQGQHLTAVSLAIEQLTTAGKDGKTQTMEGENLTETDGSDGGLELADQIADTQIANIVEAMVNRALDRNYITEMCFSYIASAKNIDPDLKEICMYRLRLDE